VSGASAFLENLPKVSKRVLIFEETNGFFVGSFVDSFCTRGVAGAI
jgi:hypothetical protein